MHADGLPAVPVEGVEDGALPRVSQVGQHLHEEKGEGY